METAAAARKKVAERGPRFAIVGSIRPGEDACSYADTAEKAGRVAEDYRKNWGYYQVTVYPPEQYADAAAELSRLGRERQQAKRALDDKTNQVRALTIHLVQEEEEALSEVDAAQRAQVDRMTVRKWLGKR